MKRSNLLLIILSVTLLSGLFITDHLLVIQYGKIDLSDPYKNFQSIPVQPFKALKITGGNGYAIRVSQGNAYNIRVMNSRKSFFKMEMLHDTLSIIFTVANQNYQTPEASTIGLVISMPGINFLQLSGTNNEIGPFKLDSLNIVQDKNTFTRTKKLELNYLKILASGISHFGFQTGNKVRCLSINLKNSAVVNFQQVNFKKITPDLQDSAAIILNRQSLDNLMYPENLSKDSLRRDRNIKK